MKNADKPAYPTLDKGELKAPGLTKREAFAMAAMQGILAASGDNDGFLQYEEQSVAKSAVKLADELLKQLEP